MRKGRIATALRGHHTLVDALGLSASSNALALIRVGERRDELGDRGALFVGVPEAGLRICRSSGSTAELFQQRVSPQQVETLLPAPI